MHSFLSTFGKDHGIVIGVVHFPPLPGHEGAPSLDVARENAFADLRAFEEGGVSGIIIENNYDLPHTITAGPGTIAAMTTLGREIRAATKLPMGVCVLWNDIEGSFTVARDIGAQFVRIPVFVDEVETDFGHVKGDPKEILAIRARLGAERVRIVVDIHVKHSRVLSRTSIGEAATLAIAGGADGVIVTGDWTGHPPSAADLRSVRRSIPQGAIFAGSGA